MTGLVRHQGGESVSGRMIQRGEKAITDEALRLAANQGMSDRTLATGTFAQIVSMQARSFWKDLSSWTTYLDWSGDFAFFLLGLYAGRRRLFEQVATHRQLIRKVMWWALPVGLAGTAAVMTMHWARKEITSFPTGVLADLAARVGPPALALAYLAALTLLLQRSDWKRGLAPIGIVGRMALTNYLLQVVAFVLLFFGYGLGWYAVGAFVNLMLALAVIPLLIVASRWWFRRFSFGPAEWLWRSLTYGKRQRMRISNPVVGSSEG